jgi:opacity protein-like surface antigen
MHKRLIFVFGTLLALTIFLETSGVQAEEGHHTFGVQAGEVGLTQDVGTTYGNALGGGLFFDYAASDFLEFELNWLSSHHSNNNLNLTQNAYAAAVQIDIETYDIFTPYIKGGAEFVQHSQDITSGTTTSNYNTTGFGLDLGAGARVDFTKHLMAGLDFTYHSLFNTTVTPNGANYSINTIESYFTVMLRFGFTFGGK